MTTKPEPSTGVLTTQILSASTATEMVGDIPVYACGLKNLDRTGRS